MVRKRGVVQNTKEGHEELLRKDDVRKGQGIEPTFSLMLREPHGTVIDHVDALLLNGLAEKKSITEAARYCNISYRNAWERLRRIQKNSGHKVVEARPGGRTGGSASLTQQGMNLLKEYKKINDYLYNALGEKDYWQHASYRLSARNRLRAHVIEIERGSVISEIKMELDSTSVLTSLISNEAVDDLSLMVGDAVDAIVKATEVIVAKRT